MPDHAGATLRSSLRQTGWTAVWRDITSRVVQ